MRSLRPSHPLSLALLAGSAALPAQAPGAGAPAANPPAAQPAAPAPTAARQQPPADGPWRLNAALGTPDWLKVSGEHRARYESLDNQFRFPSPNANPPVRGYAENDDAVMLQTLLRVDAGGGETLGATFEGIDARQYGLHDEPGTANDSNVDATMVDTLDVLQAYGTWRLGALGNGTHELRVGRETIDLGGRRLVARNLFRNTINAFTGASWLWQGEASMVRAFWTLPVDRRPGDADDLLDNRQEWDDQDLDVQFGGLFFDSRLAGRARYEVYAFGLDERGRFTRQRELLTFGGRIHQPRKAGDWFYAVELIGQTGESKTTKDAIVSDHRAGLAHAELGYQWEARWNPAIQVAYDYATGDKDPNDRDNERFDTLFGARRWEFGPTGLYGAVARANLNSPEVRLLLQPRKHLQFTVGWRMVMLAEDRDAWTASGLRDRTGSSGNHVGDQYELRMVWEVAPQSVDFDFGICYLAEGSFQDRASQGQGDDVTFGYAQLRWRF
ncbi:MAG: alginate export family protein [Phycisphaerales bacterium]|nr:alginate export family protein [Phycisphaerales bacterium]